MKEESLNGNRALEFGTGLWVDMMLKIIKKPVEDLNNGGLSCKTTVGE